MNIYSHLLDPDEAAVPLQLRVPSIIYVHHLANPRSRRTMKGEQASIGPRSYPCLLFEPKRGSVFGSQSYRMSENNKAGKRPRETL